MWLQNVCPTRHVLFLSPMLTTSSFCSGKNYIVANFELHSAAASGNQGLVEYALGRGQPVNSVIDGVLPLHAACAGGHEQVVKVLIDHGADVNAPRYVSTIIFRSFDLYSLYFLARSPVNSVSPKFSPSSPLFERHS